MRLFTMLSVLGLLAAWLGCGPTATNEDYWIDDGGIVRYLDGGPTHCSPETPQDCDNDGDQYTPSQGDCDDADPLVNPGANECNANGNGDGKDNNCNQRIDDGCFDTDEDQDGYTVGMGDCEDFDRLVSPASYEVPGNSKDDNCDGQIDEEINCDCGGTFNPQDVQSYINALDMCGSPQIYNPVLNGNPQSHNIFPSFGPYAPRVDHSCNVVILSSGVAGDTDPQMGTDLDVEYSPNPANYPENPAVQYEPDVVYDYSEIRMSLLVPANALSFSFDFVYLTSEYPEWSCTEFNDTFIAWMVAESFTGNISFDEAGNTIQVNSAFFTETSPAQLTGTGYGEESFSCSSTGGRTGCTLPSVGSTCTVGGSTGWLTTTAPVTPNEVIDLTFSVFDEGDHILDSMVLIDNFRWEIEGSGGPCTDPDGCLQ